VATEGVVSADPERLGSLFENLFRNAVEHGGADRVRVADRETGFVVDDDGSGVPEETRERVFDRGFTTNEDGTGLGLAIVESIADAHGWSARVEESPAGGARFGFETTAAGTAESDD
jgi:signal transduction histidine kinase